jgi:hypothetical protein
MPAKQNDMTTCLETFEKELKMQFFPPRAPSSSPKPRKKPWFFIFANKKLGSAEATKHRKKHDVFVTSRNTVITGPSVDAGLFGSGSAAGGAAVYNHRLPPKAAGKDTGAGAGARI